MKKTITIFIVIILVALGFFFLTRTSPDEVEREEQETTTREINNGESEQTSDEKIDEGKSVIGKSVEGRDIVAHHFGNGGTKLLFVGGVHGGYSWNTAFVAYELVDYLEENPSAVPTNVKVTVIPVLNPDGLNKVVGTASRFSKASVPSSQEQTIPGRFNANNVDLNRNFDCDWQTNATWQDKAVSGGSAAFSEPESKALKNYVESNNPDAVVVWYSAVGGVFASNCHESVLAETREITNVYADASGYRAYEEFNFYEITGDAVNWMAKKKIPAISVLLTTHEDIEWERNKRGIEALFKHYAE